MNLRFLIMVLVLNFNLNAQNELEYSEVVEVNEVSKDILYSKGLIWFAETFKDSRAVIEVKDREAGIIIGNGFFKYSALKGLKYRDVQGYIEFTIKVMFKDGRSKIELKSFTHRPNYEPYSLGIISDSEDYPYSKVNKGINDKWHQTLWEDLKSKVPLQANSLLENFTKFIIKNANQTDDW